jgi:hypothetical protein
MSSLPESSDDPMESRTPSADIAPHRVGLVRHSRRDCEVSETTLWHIAESLFALCFGHPELEGLSKVQVG